MTVPPITDADAVIQLVELAQAYERVAELTPRFRARYSRYAAAIRWALDLTAFPVDAPEGPNG